MGELGCWLLLSTLNGIHWIDSQYNIQNCILIHNSAEISVKLPFKDWTCTSAFSFCSFFLFNFLKQLFIWVWKKIRPKKIHRRLYILKFCSFSWKLLCASNETGKSSSSNGLSLLWFCPAFVQKRPTVHHSVKLLKTNFRARLFRDAATFLSLSSSSSSVCIRVHNTLNCVRTKWPLFGRALRAQKHYLVP